MSIRRLVPYFVAIAAAYVTTVAAHRLGLDGVTAYAFVVGIGVPIAVAVFAWLELAPGFPGETIRRRRRRTRR